MDNQEAPRNESYECQEGPLRETSLTMDERFCSYLRLNWNRFKDNIPAAVKSAAQVFQEQGEDASKWWSRYEKIRPH